MEPLTLAGALVVVHDMRPEDAACVRAIAGCEPGDWFAIERFQTHGVALELVQDGQPVVIAGLALPNVWTGVLWMVARPSLRLQSWRKLVRTARTVLKRACDPKHPEYRHRIEAHVLASWPGAQRFVEALGFRLEHTRLGAGSRGEDLQVWVRLGPPKER